MTSTPPASSSFEPPTGGNAAAWPEWAPTTTEEFLTRQMVEPADGTAAAPRPGLHEIGKLITADTRELFVSCDAAEAIRQQIEYLGCVYLALHDVGPVMSRQLLRQLAAHGGSPVRQLVIRQQGYGTTLAMLEYVLFEAPGLPRLQIYSTAAETTPAARQAVARTLTGLSTATVFLLNEAPGQGAANALRAAMQGVHQPDWTCPNLLIVPLGPNAATAAASQSSQVVRRHGLLVRATPQPTRPSEAWSYILGFWKKHCDRGRLAPLPAGTSATTALPPLHLDFAPVPPPAAPALRPAPAASSPPAATPDGKAYVGLAPTYLRMVSQLAGLLGCCVFDGHTGVLLAHMGSHSGQDLARQGFAMLQALQAARRAMSLGDAVQEMMISSEHHHQVVRPLPGHDLVLHCVLDRHKTNQSLVRYQLQRLDAWLSRQPRGNAAPAS